MTLEQLREVLDAKKNEAVQEVVTGLIRIRSMRFKGKMAKFQHIQTKNISTLVG